MPVSSAKKEPQKHSKAIRIEQRVIWSVSNEQINAAAHRQATMMRQAGDCDSFSMHKQILQRELSKRLVTLLLGSTPFCWKAAASLFSHTRSMKRVHKHSCVAHARLVMKRRTVSPAKCQSSADLASTARHCHSPAAYRTRSPVAMA